MLLNNFSNKKGEKLISVYWFVILTLVAGGIFIMVSSFYNSPYDVREIESSILADKVGDCIYLGGKMNPLVLGLGDKFKESFRDNFLDICSLTFDTRQEWDPAEYFVRVSFYRDSRKINPFFDFAVGNLNYEEDCFAEEKYNEFAQCSIKDFYAVSPEGKSYFVEIVAATGKTDENI